VRRSKSTSFHLSRNSHLCLLQL